ncbi:3-methyl-2-oxobutanoate hydroxymethyltransferase [Brevirhabdus pacifica]|uniref:3-methyl-2-oxobutanoate hydroxymethyltransferase n=1 Tax=Brevirhabdus pacifica TaxID=1267768 RepID=A0A1U7DHV6_9RHOB|nr:3-methyl-2-oxobutanoate hydroxymethyltransferase [Brevirhabdus pacifica]APX89479.1 3-methyl-2-oxobutanoate hydroxymethyltransferase [Brevirhabdus pacifica]OWU76514.1 3-methyl-2-oxobutanoate hydroxymethyltransferase [Loktanella sp. 22II-4b]PJJ85871.1 3-methyl-2-oxobutanoate hydroxymethyltransferase [Brevirhabdus pacifica]
MAKITIPALQAKKRAGEKIFGLVVWDYQMAQIADRAGADIISVGDTVGHNLWGQPNPLEITMDQMITVTQAVRRGTKNALLSADFPYGPLQEGADSAVSAAIRFVKEAGVDMIKLDGAADFPEATTALVKAGIPVWAQFGVTPQTALSYGMEYGAMNRTDAHVPEGMTDRLIEEALMLEAAGASMLDFTNSGPVVGPKVVERIGVPVIGGFGGGPWLDGRVRMANAAIGYNAKSLDSDAENYANVAKIIHGALTELGQDVRAARQIKGTPPAK